MPCCSGPATPTSSRSGCAMPISATKKPMKSPVLVRPWTVSAMRQRQHHRQADRGHQLHHGVRQPLGEDQPHVGAQIVLVHRVELRLEVRLGVVDLDETRRLEALLGDPGDIAHRVLDAAAVAAELAVDDRHQPGHQRSHGERQQREPHVVPQHQRDAGEDRERGAHQHHHRVGGRLSDLLGVDR